MQKYLRPSESTIKPNVERVQRHSSARGHRVEKYNHSNLPQENDKFVCSSVVIDPKIYFNRRNRKDLPLKVYKVQRT